MASVPAGTRTATLCYDADFYPYGGERVITNTCSQNYKFEAKERDAETGNDNFGARYYSSVYGRFLSADWSDIPAPVPYANLTNPQTLNLYAMVRDNPESYADLDGHDPPAGTAGGCGDATTGCGGTNAAANILKQTGQVLKDTAVGVTKELSNELTGLANAVNAPIDAALAKLGVGFDFGQGTMLQASTPGEKGAMIGTSLGLLLVGGGETKIGDAISLSKSLASEAQVAEKGTVIAGAGAASGKALRDAPRLAAQYGGKAGDWAKMSSSAFQAIGETHSNAFQTHWYENVVSGLRTEYKTIMNWMKPE